MRSRPFTALAVMLLATLLVPLRSLAARADEVEDRVKEIRARYAAIEEAKLRTGETVEFDAQDEPLSASCTRYYQGEQLVKVKLSYTMGDHGGSDEYFYYRDGELIFAHASDSSWRFGGKEKPDGEPGTIDGVVEHRVYFDKGKPVRHLFKEAATEDPKTLRDLLKKAPNKTCDDAQRATRLSRHGMIVTKVKTAADLGKLLTDDE